MRKKQHCPLCGRKELPPGPGRLRPETWARLCQLADASLVIWVWMIVGAALGASGFETARMYPLTAVLWGLWGAAVPLWGIRLYYWWQKRRRRKAGENPPFLPGYTP